MSKNNRILSEARRIADSVAASLPHTIQIAALSLNSKLPFKALSIRELLIHRVSALAKPAVDLFEQEQFIPAIVLTRSVAETVAFLFCLHERIERFLNDKDVKALDDFLMSCLLSSRTQPDLHKAINVLTLIDRVDKGHPGFRSVYDILSEYAHPNWSGRSEHSAKSTKNNLN
ncbi:MAG TPA: hypothetical protein VK452_02655 [Dissulfurispiraceae bacterium]|nr:hypothetical protein [Dissulfurispiraceae bacterium]